jgi:CRP-like cAMP-binding protein
MQGSASPRSNKLLDQLSTPVLAAVLPHLRLRTFAKGAVLTEIGKPPRFLHFLVSGVVGRVVATPDEESVDFLLAGNEGLIGIGLLFGEPPASNSLSSSVVLVDTTAFLCAANTAHELLLNVEFRAVMLRYLRFILADAMQAALCYRHHTLQQQLCRWLLNCADRVGSPTLEVTHQLISRMLGVDRARISESAGALQQAGIIELRRGAIRIRNRNGLLEHSCACYAALTREYSAVAAATVVRKSP